MRDRLKVVFLPNFNVTNGQHVYPAADLSEQISTAGKEASGTGNMKFSLNGALTIGTLDGANIEIREEVGADNFFLFGLNAEQVRAVKSCGYRSMDYYEQNPVLREVVNCIGAGLVKGEEAGLSVRWSKISFGMIPFCCSPTTNPTLIARIRLARYGLIRKHGDGALF